MMMFRDRYFNLALFASLIWHVGFMLLFSPFVKSGNIKAHHTNISFLGSVLDGACFTNKRHIVLDRFYPYDKKKAGDDFGNDLFTVQKDDIDFSSIQPLKEKVVLAAQEKKEIFKISNIRKGPQLNFLNFLVKGPAKNRLIVYKPELPKALIFPLEFSSNYSANIKFKVSKYGFVERPEFMVSSGSYEIDKIALRHIRKWQFAPSSEGQEGMIRLNIEVR